MEKRYTNYIFCFVPIQLKAKLEKYPIITQNRALRTIVEAANCAASSGGMSESPVA